MKAEHKAAVVGALAVIITGLHYLLNPQIGPVHELLGRAYYVPIVLGGLWFGWRGGLLTALIISIPFAPHAFHGWSSPYSIYFRILELVMYHVIGAVVGVLAERTQRALKIEQQSREEKAAAYEKLRQKTEELFRMEEHLRRSERLASLGKLSAGLAHEIRNPLGSIKTSAEYLQRQSSQQQQTADPERPDFTAVLLEETERLDRIVNRFLEFARDETRQHTAEPDVCCVGEVVRKIQQLFSHQLTQQDIELRYKGDDPGYSVQICESHLRQVLINLCLNSIEAIGEHGWLQIETGAEPDGSVKITLSDSGPGIPSEIAGNIFDPFFTTKEKGTGLGLAIVERIVTAQNGIVRLIQNSSTNARFELRFPQAR